MTTTVDEPTRIARLPRTPDARNFPVPFFVSWIDNKPDFRVADGRALVRCVLERLCWICGGRLTRHAAFVVGPMCTVNRISAEPPSHIDCAEYAATHCPFLITPRMVRREKKLPEAYELPAGEMLMRNPGASALWVTAHWLLIDDGSGKYLFQMGDPTEVRWYAEGRTALRAEVEESIRTGLPLLEERCSTAAERAFLAEQVELASQYLPPSDD